MTVPARLAAFAGVLALVLLAGFGIGRAVGPVGESAEPAGDHVGAGVEAGVVADVEAEEASA